MEEQLQQALASILNKTVAGVEAGAAFLSAEVPDVIQQLLYWKLAQSTVVMLIAAVFLFFFYRKGITVAKAEPGSFWQESYGGPTGPAVFFWGIGLIITFFSIIGFIGSALRVVQIVVAPKIYLIEYAASLVK